MRHPLSQALMTALKEIAPGRRLLRLQGQNRVFGFKPYGLGVNELEADSETLTKP